MSVNYNEVYRFIGAAYIYIYIYIYIYMIVCVFVTLHACVHACIQPGRQPYILCRSTDMSVLTLFGVYMGVHMCLCV